MLYVYGECDGIESKSKFDLSLVNLDIATEELSDFVESSQLEDVLVSGSGDVEIEDISSESLNSDFEQDKDNFSLDILDDVADLPNTEELDSLSEESFVNESNLDVPDSLDTGENTFSTLDFDSNLNLEGWMLILREMSLRMRIMRVENLFILVMTGIM